MNDETTNVNSTALAKSIVLCIMALARPLIRCGVSFGEFTHLASIAFVKAAEQDYGIRNRPANTAKISMLTGLSRKLVKNLRESKLDSPSISDEGMTLPIRLIVSWKSSPRFAGKNGHPKVLPYRAKNEESFESLVSSVDKYASPNILRRELLRAGCIAERSDDCLELVRPFFSAPDEVQRLADSLANNVTLHLETVDFNTKSVPAESRRHERVHYISGLVPGVSVEQIQQLINPQLENTGLLLLKALETFECDSTDVDGLSPQPKVGFGTYFFANED